MQRMLSVQRRRLVASVLAGVGAVCLTGGCSGEGSDIGPRLSQLSGASCKVQVVDDANRGVVAANVAVVGTSWSAITGRNGRADLLAAPRGSVLLEVDGANGAAIDQDLLGRLTVAVTVDDRDVPMPVSLPDASGSSVVTLTAGAQVGTQAVSQAGATVSVPSGTSVGVPSGAASVELRIGELSAAHLPGALPTNGGDTVLFGRGVYLDPPELTFSPGIDVAVTGDLSLTTATAGLYWLNPDTGRWQLVASGSAGSQQVFGAITRGGLYAFGVTATAAAVSGRVVDAADPARPVSGAMVRVDGRTAVTAADGTFVVEMVPARDGEGTPRNTTLEVFAGGSWLPTVATATVTYDPLTGGFEPLGDVVLDTLRAGNVRVQQVVRARADALQPARLGSLEGGVGLMAFSDANGQVLFEDVPAGYFGFQEARRRSRDEVFYGQAVAFLDPGRRWLDSYQFLFDRPWFQGTRSNRAYVCDSIGGGPIRGAAVVQGFVPGKGLIGLTRENGLQFGERGFNGRGTATLRSELGGQVLVHAISVEGANSDHFEFALRRLQRASLGAFDRHGIVRGSMTGVTGGRQHAVRSTRRLARQEWWDELVFARPIQSSLPVDVDPATTHGAFAVGVDAVGGNVAFAETATTGGGAALEALGMLVEFEPTEGAAVAVDVPLQFVADTTYVVTDGAVSPSPDIDPAALDLDLALELPSGRIIDAARDIDGSVEVAGNDLQLRLPAITAALPGTAWLALLRGETTSMGVTTSHASLLRIDAAGPEPSFALPPPPTLSMSSTMVPVADFDVFFELPAGAIGGEVELRSVGGGEELLWQTVVRPEQTSTSFVELPPEAESPLIAGRSYTLTVTAWFGDIDIVSSDVFGEIVAYRQSIGLAEAGVTQISRRSMMITAN